MTRILVGTVQYVIEVPDGESIESADNFFLRQVSLAGERLRDGALGFAAFDDQGHRKRRVVYGEPSDEMTKIMDDEFDAEEPEGVPA